jgi:hypothetical protein
MKVHDKVKVKTNEEMFRELLMDLWIYGRLMNKRI